MRCCGRAGEIKSNREQQHFDEYDSPQFDVMYEEENLSYGYDYN